MSANLGHRSHCDSNEKETEAIFIMGKRLKMLEDILLQSARFLMFDSGVDWIGATYL